MGDQAKIRAASPVEQVYYRIIIIGIIITIHIMCIDHYYRHYYGYYPYYYNPGAAVVGTAAAVATFPFWGWGYPYY